jgi:class 3 adenylate cyclase
MSIVGSPAPARGARWARLGALVAGDPAAVPLEQRIYNISTFINVVLPTGSLTINLALSGFPLLLNLAIASYVATSGALYFRSRRHGRMWPLAYMLATQVFISITWFFNGGLVGSTPYAFFVLLFLAVVVLKRVPPMGSTLLVLGNVAGLVAVERLRPGWIVPYPDESTRYFDIASTLILILVVLATWLNMLKRNYDAERAKVERAHQRSEELLLNILPAEIAAVLKDREQVIATHYPEASILFADLVDFTPLATRLPPSEVVVLLNEVFTFLDTLVDRHGLEKIKTIGDCYMVAAGVPRPRDDHAHVLARVALEIRQFLTEREFAGRRLSFRIGIASGPLVAGVIGKKKFAYDLWGDTVNTASRMESHGAPGIIQITGRTHELIRDQFACRSGGIISVKGKGEMEVWHVVEQRGTSGGRASAGLPAT